MRAAATVSNALVCAILDGIDVPPAQRERLVAEAGLATSALHDLTARTSIAKLARLWRRVLRVTGDEFAGLAIGARARTEQFGLGAHVAQHGEDLRAALVRFTRYAGLVNDLLECRLDEAPPLARFRVRLRWNVLGLERHAIDLTFAAVHRFASRSLAAPFGVREVRVRHTLARGEPRYHAQLGAPVVFGAKDAELVFDAAALDTRVAASSPELAQVLDRFASQELARIPASELPARVRQVVTELLAQGDPVELAAAADALDLTARSLQRKLREHATSFSLLVDDARRELAPAWLAEAEANVEQVGFRLGYADPTAFIRAFKKWFGVTPGAFRRARASP